MWDVHTWGWFWFSCRQNLSPFKQDFLTLENNIKILIIFSVFFLPLHGEAVWHLENDHLRAGESSGALMTGALHVLPVDDGWSGAAWSKKSHSVCDPQVFVSLLGTVDRNCSLEQPELPDIQRFIGLHLSHLLSSSGVSKIQLELHSAVWSGCVDTGSPAVFLLSPCILVT